MLIFHIIGEGPGTYEAVYQDSAQAARFVPEFTSESGMFLTAVFWLEKLTNHARNFRLVRKSIALEYASGLPGFWMLIPFLAEPFEVPGEEHLPTFVRQVSDGGRLCVEENDT